jgi:hypothetical protein
VAAAIPLTEGRGETPPPQMEVGVHDTPSRETHLQVEDTPCLLGLHPHAYARGKGWASYPIAFAEVEDPPLGLHERCGGSGWRPMLLQKTQWGWVPTLEVGGETHLW